LGLDLNSPAVIIGAMLISPLMSPILGIGLGVGINDRETLSSSLQHFMLAAIIALVTSYVYFRFITPFGDVTDEISARTAPNLLDGLVAIFGGTAGVISTTRKDKSNAIPGVAIATALMPPLCVTGFGIAKGNWTFMLNSFYLFFMNATFVALATFLIVRFLKFPQKAFANEMEQRKTQLFIILFSAIMIIPGISIFWNILERSAQERVIEEYVDQNFPYAIYEIERIADTDSVEVKISQGNFITPDSINRMQDILRRKGADHAKLLFVQNASFKKDIENLKITKQKYLETIEDNQKSRQSYENTIADLGFTIDSLTGDALLFRRLCEEAKVIFPELEAISLSNNAFVADLKEEKEMSIPILYLGWNEELKKSRRKKQLQEKEKILINWVKVRASIDTLKVTH